MPSTKVKQERSAGEAESVDVNSDSDDSVIEVPFVKPTPPVVNLVESDDDGHERTHEQDLASQEPNEERQNDCEETTTQNGAVSWELSTTPSGGNDAQEVRTKKKKKKKNRELPEITDAQKTRKQKRKERWMQELADLKAARQKKKQEEAAEKELSKSKQSENASPKKKKRKRNEEEQNSVELEIPLDPVPNEPPVNQGESSEKAKEPNETVSVQVTVTPKRKSRSKSASTGETSTSESEPKKKKVRKKALTAAEIDHLNFLKTLNLRANIGFDEHDMLKLTLSPGDFAKPTYSRRQNKLTERMMKAREEANQDSDTSNTTISTDLDPRESNRPIFPVSAENSPTESPESTEESSATQESAAESGNNLLPTAAFVTVTEEKSKKSKKKGNKQKPSLLPSVTDSEKSCESPSTSSQQPGSLKASSSTPRRSEAASSAPSPTTPLSTLARSSPAIIQTTEERSTESPNKRKSKTKEKDTPKNPHEEEDGVFTHKELSEVQSSIRLNITGLNTTRSPSEGADENYRRHRDNTVGGHNTSAENSAPKQRKNFRYFDPQNEASRAQVENDSQEGNRKKRRRNDGESRDDYERPKKRKSEEQNGDERVRGEEGRGRMPLQNLHEDDEAAVREAETSQGYGYRSFPSTWTEEMKQFYGTVRGSSLDVREVISRQNPSPRLWQIPKDLEPERYRGKKIRCNNCNQMGYHVAAQCPEPRRRPVCVMCGEVGHKTQCMYDERNWPKKRPRVVKTVCPKGVCLNCRARTGGKGSMKGFVQACNACHEVKFNCDCCGSTTHRTSQCPDNWRRFHSTTVDYDDRELVDLVRSNELQEELQRTLYRPRQEEYCSNCARKGHNYYKCPSRRDLNLFYPPAKPYIVQELPESIRNRPSAAQASSVVQQVNDDVHDQSSHVAQSRNEASMSSKSSRKEKQRRKSDERKTSKRKSEDRRPSSSEDNRPRKRSAPDRTENEQSAAVANNIETPRTAESLVTSLQESGSSGRTKEVSPATDTVTDNTTLAVGPKESEHVKSSCSSSSSTLSSKTKAPPATPDKPADASKAPPATSDKPKEASRPPPATADKPPEAKEKATGDKGSPDIVVVEDSDEDIVVVKEVATPVSKGNSKQPTPKKSKDRTPENAVGKCEAYPDCQNSVPPSGPPCFKIILTRKEHNLITKLDRVHEIIKKLNTYYGAHKVSISLCQKQLEFHIGGSQYYYARDRLCRLIKDVTKEKNIKKLLPEIFPLKETTDAVGEAVVSSSTEETPPAARSVSTEAAETASGSNEPAKKEAESTTSSSEVSQSTDKPSEKAEEGLGEGKIGVQNRRTNSTSSDKSDEGRLSHGVSSINNPAVSRYDFEKRLRKLAVQYANKSEETTAAPQAPASLEPSSSKGPADPSDKPKEIPPENVESADEEVHYPEDYDEQGHHRDAGSVRRSRGTPRGRFRGRGGRPGRGQSGGGQSGRGQSGGGQSGRGQSGGGQSGRGHSGGGQSGRGQSGRGQYRFPLTNDVRPPPQYGMPYGYQPPLRPPPPQPDIQAPHDIDERYLPVEERTRANPFQWPNSPFANPFACWTPAACYVIPQQQAPQFAPNFATNDFYSAVSTPDGFIMDRQFFTGPQGTPLFDPQGPPPRPRYHPN